MDKKYLYPALAGAGGVVGLIAVSRMGGASVLPMRPMPAVVTRDDFWNYQHSLAAHLIALNEDIGANLVLDDPLVEAKKVQDYCAAAAATDGCTAACINCPGWSMDENKDAFPLPPKGTAMKLRAMASTAAGAADYAERQVGKHDPSKANWDEVAYDWRSELAFVDRWRNFKQRFLDYSKQALDDITVFTGTEFEQLQRFDLEYQGFRAGYQALSGKAPAMAMPLALPETDNPLLTGVKYVSVAAVALSGAYLAYKLVKAPIIDVPLLTEAKSGRS